MSYQIRVCPFCDSSSVRLRSTEDRHEYWVDCRRCRAVGPIITVGMRGDFEKETGRAKQRAIEKWNTETGPRPTVEVNRCSVVREHW